MSYSHVIPFRRHREHDGRSPEHYWRRGLALAEYDQYILLMIIAQTLVLRWRHSQQAESVSWPLRATERLLVLLLCRD